MSDPTPEPRAARAPHAPLEPPRTENVRGFVESARMWARQQGLPVPPHGPLPDDIVARYRRRQSRE